jgi:hypothetical protein
LNNRYFYTPSSNPRPDWFPISFCSNILHTITTPKQLSIIRSRLYGIINPLVDVVFTLGLNGHPHRIAPEPGLGLSRPARNMRLWFTVRVLGRRLWGRFMERGVELADFAKGLIEALNG